RTDPQYYAGLESRLSQALGDVWQRVSFQPVLYAPILQQAQDDLWQRMLDEPTNQLRAKTIRRFLLDGLSDAASLENSASRDPRQYIAVQMLIYQALEQAFIALGHQEKPVIIVAHSLGAQVVSNYLWDAQKNLQLFAQQMNLDSPLDRFTRLKSCARLITTGCNIPLFVGGLNELTCFKPPNPKFVWDNYYDADDVLGWPIAQLSASYQAVVADHPVRVGNFLTGWNPLSHNGYWTSSNVYQPIVRAILQGLDRA
ncbi:MAG: hypothetical protein ACPHV3_09040, partial [Vibrio sp.]